MRYISNYIIYQLNLQSDFVRDMTEKVNNNDFYAPRTKAELTKGKRWVGV